jgi:hypothetical protein
VRAVDDVGDVLLVQDQVVTGAEPAEMTADELLPRVGHGPVRGVDVPGYVLAEVEVVDRHPAGVDDVDEHERVVVREVNVDVVRRVVRPVIGQFDPLAADLERVAVLEGDLRRGSRRVVIP